MQKIKLQHYVPRFYLKNFATKKGNSFSINCYDKTDSKTFLVNITGIAGENYFYDTDQDTSQLVEKTLGKFEGKFNVAYKKLIDSQNLGSLSNEEKTAMAYFVAVQMIRTKESRERYKHNITQLHELLSKEKMTDNLKKQFEEATSKEAIKSNHIQMLLEFPPQFVSIMNAMKWCLVENKTIMPYWTSDHPITMYNPIEFKNFGNLGLAVPGIQIFFPLNPGLCLSILDPVQYAHHPDKIVSTDIENATFHNWLQVKHSTRHIFSYDSNFQLADKILTDVPELRDINRKRGTWKFLGEEEKNSTESCIW